MPQPQQPQNKRQNPNVNRTPSAPAPTPVPAPVQRPVHTYPAPRDMTANPKGEGVYQMTRPDGKTVGIPYSTVPDAQAQGYQLVGHTWGTGDSRRYWNDRDADRPIPKTLSEQVKTDWDRVNTPFNELGIRDKIAHQQALAGYDSPRSWDQVRWDANHQVLAGTRDFAHGMAAGAANMYITPFGVATMAAGPLLKVATALTPDAEVLGPEVPKVLKAIPPVIRGVKKAIDVASTSHGAIDMVTNPRPKKGESSSDYWARMASDAHEIIGGVKSVREGWGAGHSNAPEPEAPKPEPEAPKPEPQAPKPDSPGSVGTGSEVSPPSPGATPASNPQLALPAPEPRLMLSDHTTTTGEVQPMFYMQAPQPYPALATDYAKMRTRRPRFPVPQVAPEWGGEITPAGVVVRPEPRMLPAPGRMADDATTEMFGDLGKRGEPIHSTSGQMPMTEPQLALPAPKPQLALPAPEPRLMLSDHGTAGDAQSMFYMKAPQPYPPLASDYARMRITPPRVPVPQVVPEWGGEITPAGVVIRPQRLMLPAPTPGAQDMTSLKWNGQ